MNLGEADRLTTDVHEGIEHEPGRLVATHERDGDLDHAIHRRCESRGLEVDHRHRHVEDALRKKAVSHRPPPTKHPPCTIPESRRRSSTTRPACPAISALVTDSLPRSDK